MTFTTEQLDKIKKAINKIGEEHKISTSISDWLIVELTKPKLKQNEGQVYYYWGNGGFAKYRDDHIISAERPLTTKEAGPECMAHLVAGLEEILKEDGRERHIAYLTLNEHKELMK